MKKYNKIKYVLQIRSYFTGLFSAVLSRALVVNDLHLRNGMPRWYVILDSKNYGDEIVKLQPLATCDQTRRRYIFIQTKKIYSAVIKNDLLPYNEENIRIIERTKS